MYYLFLFIYVYIYYLCEYWPKDDIDRGRNKSPLPL